MTKKRVPEFHQSWSKKELYEAWMYWQKSAKTAIAATDYYREQLAKAHEVLGRVIHQTSHRWDSVHLTEYYPTDNLHGLRTAENPSGKKEAL